MKKLMKLMALCLIPVLALVTGCSKGAGDAGREVVEIRDKMFIAQMNEINANAGEYLGKLIRYEGVFNSNAQGEGPEYSVVRYGPGCCGNDGNVGFEVVWDQPYPDQDDWVSVEGELERYEKYGNAYLRLRLSALEVKDEWGEANVVQ